MSAQTEAEFLRQQHGTFTLAELYAAIEAADLTTRADGEAVIHGRTDGLTYVNSIAVGKIFPMRTTRRFAHAHWRVTVMCQGPLTSTRRVFIPPPDLPRAASGAYYPQDFWPVGSVGRADARPGQLRYPNSLPVRLVDRVAGAFTRSRDLLVDPFLGGGTSAYVALLRGLRFIGGDTNPLSLAFTAHRISREALAA